MFEGGELRLVLLKLIAEQPRHGYDLIRAIEELTGGAIRAEPGVVYPTLTMLQDMGLIEEAAGEGGRKPFQITEAGTAHLEENEEEAEELIVRLKRAQPLASSGGRLAGVARDAQPRHGASATGSATASLDEETCTSSPRSSTSSPSGSNA